MLVLKSSVPLRCPLRTQAEAARDAYRRQRAARCPAANTLPRPFLPGAVAVHRLETFEDTDAHL